MKAIWNGAILADSNDTIIIEGNHYFPSDSINKQYFTVSNTRTTCPWKGVASYYTLVVGGQKNEDAAWCYTEPKEAAKMVKDSVAFRKGVEVVE